MLYFVILTRVCDLRCIYCGNEPDEAEPAEITYSLHDLIRFISWDPEPIVAFYGGEPFLRIGLMCRIMDALPHARFVVQTNALHLREMPREYLSNFDVILVSIDGREHVTDFYRGRGVYRRVLESVRWLRRFYRGDVIARMAASAATDIFEDVRHLLSLGLFDHVHWQIDAMFDYPPASRYGGLRKFESWVRNVYIPGVSRLVRWWLREMEERGVVHGIVPFLGIIRVLLTGERTSLHCGAGIDAFAVMPSGRITVCPIAFGEPEFYVGDIWKTRPCDLPGRVRVGEPCTSCDLYEICGGRCLYANVTKWWGDEGFSLVCETVRHTVRELEKCVPRIEKLIESGRIPASAFDYPPFNNTTEVIP